MRYRLPSPVCLAAAALIVLAIGVGAAQPAPKTGSIDTVQAAKVFKEVQAISDRDGGKMWGAPLYGATLFVDENTRALVANRPDYQNLLKPSGEVFVGSLPAEQNVANTSVRWAGVSWTMVRWPLPEDAFERDKLVIHESFHRIQEQLGLGGPDTSNDHLDSKDGRIWLQLEWRALTMALPEQKDVVRRRSRTRSSSASTAGRSSPRRRPTNGPSRWRGARRIHGRGPCAKTPTMPSRTPRAPRRCARSIHLRPLLRLRHRPRLRPPPGRGEPRMAQGPEAKDDLSVLLSNGPRFAPPERSQGRRDGPVAGLRRQGDHGGRGKGSGPRKAKSRPNRTRFLDGPVLNVPLTEAFSYSFDPTDQVPVEGRAPSTPTCASPRLGHPGGDSGRSLMVTKDDIISAIHVPRPKSRRLARSRATGGPSPSSRGGPSSQEAHGRLRTQEDHPQGALICSLMGAWLPWGTIIPREPTA